jgi:hypothetical protein
LACSNTVVGAILGMFRDPGTDDRIVRRSSSGRDADPPRAVEGARVRVFSRDVTCRLGEDEESVEISGAVD